MIHARSIVTIYKRARDKRSRREKRETATATHGERRAGATAAPRQDEGERGDVGDADGGEAAGDREERWSVVLSLVFHADPAKKSAESAAMVKLKGEELARGRVKGVDGDGEDGR